MERSDCPLDPLQFSPDWYERVGAIVRLLKSPEWKPKKKVVVTLVWEAPAKLKVLRGDATLTLIVPDEYCRTLQTLLDETQLPFEWFSRK